MAAERSRFSWIVKTTSEQTHERLSELTKANAWHLAWNGGRFVVSVSIGQLTVDLLAGRVTHQGETSIVDAERGSLLKVYAFAGALAALSIPFTIATGSAWFLAIAWPVWLVAIILLRYWQGAALAVVADGLVELRIPPPSGPFR